MKTIVVVSNTSWSLLNFRLHLMQEMQAKGYTVLAVAPPDEYSKKLPFEYYPLHMNRKGTNPIEDLLLIRKLYKLYKRLHPDMILQYTIKPNVYGTIAAKRLSIPCINTITGLGTLFVRRRPARFIAILLYKYSQKYASKIFFQNDDDMQRFIRKKIVQKSKSEMLPGSGIDTSWYRPVDNKHSDKFIFLLFGRLLWDKGVGVFVNAARILRNKYRDVEWRMLGFLDPHNPTAISGKQVKVWEEEGVIKYMGSSIDVREYVAGADCVVLPSFYGEGVPRSLLEAASMAKPIITTDVSGCRNVVDNRVNGLLCEPRSIADLVSKMETMILLPEKTRRQMGAKGRQKVLEEFDEKLILPKYIEVIESLLDRPK